MKCSLREPTGKKKKCLSTTETAGNHDGIQAWSEGRMKRGKCLCKDKYLKSMAERYHGDEETRIEKGMKNNKTSRMALLL